MKFKILFYFILIFNFFLLVLSGKYCPHKCECIRNKVDCLNQGLLTVPRIPADAHTLDMRFNRIQEIEPGILSQLHQLRTLLFNDNRLVALRSGALDGLRRVKYIYLYRNRIQHIDADVFQNMGHLEQLYLHVNEIHYILPETFSNLPKLGRLYLHNNNLKGLPVGSFKNLPKLHKLRLDSNALVCDCSMLWMVRMLAEHRDMHVAATCYEPTNVAGVPISSMTEKHFNCLHPIIEQEPEDVVVDFGEDAAFRCVASGEPTPEIIWLHDSNEIHIDGTRYQVMDNGTLMVHDADELDAGEFECMAKNTAGKVHSRPATMILSNRNSNKKRNANEPPVFNVVPQEQLARSNQAVIQLDCSAEGKPKPHLTWFLNGKKLLLNERMTLTQNGTILIHDIQSEDAGIYTCQAENLNGIINASAILSVAAAPYFVVVPKDIRAVIGDRAEFQCLAEGTPKPTLTWFVDTLPVELNANIILSEAKDNLTILEVDSNDEGIYHCKAENQEGFVEASSFLRVTAAPIIPAHISLKPEDTDAYKETRVQLPCEVESEPPATIEWRKDGSRIEPNDKFSITLIGSLIINNVSVADNGRYECSVYNGYGRDTASIYLSVKDQKLPGDAYVNIALTEATRDVDQAIERTIDGIFKNKNSSVGIKDLYKMSTFPNAPEREVARSAEIYERALVKIKEFVSSGRKVTSVNPFNYQSLLSGHHLEVIARLSGCVAHREIDDCSDMCYHGKYRSMDGTCNNFDNPRWGMSLSGFRRILLPVYENGFSQPVGWNKNRLYNGFTLPSARLVSNTIITTTIITQDVQITHMVMQWGQWLDHDLDHSLPPVSVQTWDGIDCKKTCEYAAPCFPIDVPPNDPRITNRRCIDFIRTSSVCGSGSTSALFGTLQMREQINQLTSYIDASQVYGFEKAVAVDLRDLTNYNGLLRVGATFPGKKPLLPTTGLNQMDCRRNLDESNRNCFVAGDIRANEQVGLAAMHTIWMREHNRVALHLKTINPVWDGDKVYQEARKIVGAEIQMITYDYWLPLILGPEGYEQLGKYKDYDNKLNPSISNVFATAALRFGHSMINPVLHRYDENFEPIPQGHLLLRHAFFSPWRLVDEGGVDPLIRGMFMTPAKLKTPTQNLNSELTEKLFHTAHAVALDLAAINIQRGRDHGIPPYTKWRQFCNMSEVNNFDDLAGEIKDETVRDKLEEVYGSVHNIDVWVGGILEDQVQGGKVGPLFRCLLLEQFTRLRDGDRFWYEHPNNFKREQLQQIKRTSLARVLCDNGDSIDTIGENVFLLPELQDGLISCEDLQGIDFRYWADCETCGDEDGEVQANRRARRQTTADPPQQEPPELARLATLEDSQLTLIKTIDELKQRVLDLEETFKLEDTFRNALYNFD